MNRAFRIIVAVTGVACAAPALAQSFTAGQFDPNPRSVRVRQTDLDLTTATGRAALNRRIIWAVRGVCAMPHPGTPIISVAEQRCRKRTSLTAHVDVGVAIAAAYHDRGSRGELAQRGR